MSLSCASLSCNSAKQCDLKSTIDFSQHRGRGVPGCSTMAKDCDGCLHDCDLVECGPLEMYAMPGCEEWEPSFPLPGWEEAEKRAVRMKLDEPLSEFQQIVRLLDLKRCPRCSEDWTAEHVNFDHATPLLTEESVEGQYSRVTSCVVTHKGKNYTTPFAELIGQAVKLCPFCSCSVHGRSALMDWAKQKQCAAI
eukprot:CAMPEP_0171058220 /NCGR_PEP_ID=MMETSP0766_2-20121228/2360_1 /TAXON_ID=439317 /ORGANISM="Gambierdiscus australes, Strain CAWD 149" /LENGTH=193 /DNA_ID=CAMNT_0011513469 /DNA_START=32 /DNA_END=613 /DNA_ORIENTATION=-